MLNTCGIKKLLVYRGDDNMFRAKEECIRREFYYTRLKEGNNVTQYVNHIKHIISAIDDVAGTISASKIICSQNYYIYIFYEIV